MSDPSYRLAMELIGARMPQVGEGTPLRATLDKLTTWVIVCDQGGHENFLYAKKQRKARRTFRSWGWLVEGHQGEHQCLCPKCNPNYDYKYD